MKTLFTECFEATLESKPIDPLLWVMIALALIGGLLSIAVWLMLERRQRQIKSLMEKVAGYTIDQSVSSTSVSSRRGKVKGLSLLNDL